MGSVIDLYPPERCQPRLTDRDSCPQGRLADYRKGYTVPALHYRVVPWAGLVSGRLVGIQGHSRLIPETVPFQRLPARVAEGLQLPHLSVRERLRLKLRSLLPAGQRIEGAACCLMDLRMWHHSYFHWFIDALPRVLAAEHHGRHTGEICRLIVPEDLRSWQRDSLTLMGWDNSRLIPLNPQLNFRSIAVERLICASFRGMGRSDAAIPWDAMTPAVIRTLQERLAVSSGSGYNDNLPQRIYLSRGDAPTRRVVNEAEIMPLLISHGFERVELQGMTLRHQIVLFRNATHVIAPHGAGLTNLLHARHASVLELFQSGHGIRPDFFQLASILGLDYRHDVCPSLNARDDIRIDPSLIRQHLAAVD
jgi:capsular polysaccharide biosynthesis protein